MSSGGILVNSGGVTGNSGLTVVNSASTIVGNTQYSGTLSVTAASATSAVVDVYYNAPAAFSGNVIQGRVPAGTSTGNAMLLTEGSNDLFQVSRVRTIPPACPQSRLPPPSFATR